jgi:nucleoside-diphosphate-sugar epimerase
MAFGPIVHPVDSFDKLNESSAMLWKIVQGEPLAKARVPFWIDVRDLAQAHVQALVRPEAGDKRFIPGPTERFSYDLAAQIIEEEFLWAKGEVRREQQEIDESHGIDGATAARELGLKYRPFRETVAAAVSGVLATVNKTLGKAGQ